MKTITLTVDGMSCAHCEKAVKTALSAIDGVKKVDVNLKGKSVTVQCGESVPQADLVNAIEDQGYDVIS